MKRAKVENEWQPVIVIRVKGHLRPGAPSRKAIKYPVKVLARVSHSRQANYICDAERFYEIHPDDSIKYWGTRNLIGVCEHKVLAD
jgi:hypothetical protein